MRQTEYLPGVLKSNPIGITGLVWQRSKSTQHWYLIRQLLLAALNAHVTPVKHRCYRFLWKPAVFLLTRVKFFLHEKVSSWCQANLWIFRKQFVSIQPLLLLLLFSWFAASLFSAGCLGTPTFSVSTPCTMIILSFIIQTGIYFSDFFLRTKILNKRAVSETQNVSAALCYTLVKNYAISENYQ